MKTRETIKEVNVYEYLEDKENLYRFVYYYYKKGKCLEDAFNLYNSADGRALYNCDRDILILNRYIYKWGEWETIEVHNFKRFTEDYNEDEAFKVWLEMNSINRHYYKQNLLEVYDYD